MTEFEPWLPTVRVRPSVQLEYRHPLLLREQYVEQDVDTGPASEIGAIGPAVAVAVAAECDTAVGNTTESEETQEKAGPRV